MTALERLKSKIDEWKNNYELIEKENIELKQQLKNGGGASVQDTTQLEEEIARLNAEVAKLKQEIEEKDVEIEGILENIEELLD
jgi:SMC interacting uncharacterized protein involved in chromosome segregation